jgi:hypothetical protein
MKRIIITLVIAFTSLLIQAQNFNPFLAQGIISPSPLNRLEISGTGQVSFLVGNSGDDPLPLVVGQEMLLVVTLSRGIPNNANPLLAIGGSFATYFSWQYDGVSKTYLGTQNTAIPAALNGGVGDITIAYKVTSNSLKTNPQNGFNVNLTPPAYSVGINTLGDDQVSSYTWTSEQFNTNPDFTSTLLNVSVTGNVNTNDDVPVGTTYGTPVANPTNPSACAPVMSSTGSYTFVCNTPGEYEYQVPVCAPGQTSNCPTELLKITVKDPSVVTAAPTANPDVMNTLKNTATTLNVLSNDACNNGPSCTLSNPNITDQPNNGTVTVNPNGTLTYTPNPTFVGTDTIMYSTCDNQSPSKCDTTSIIVTVNPTGSANTTSANDDNATANGNTPVTGNVLTNDTDPEGNTQTVAPQNVTNAKGTFVLNANGTYTFTAAAGYSGPVEYTYTVCDNGTPSACDTATIHILVSPLPFNTDPDITATLLNVPVTGNVSTNDDVPVGTTYGTPVSNPTNPSACAPVMSSTGSYTFVCSTPGVYEYQVPVCAPGQTSNCPTELLKITVKDPSVVTAAPTANPDVMTTLKNTPTTLNVLSNDACNNGPNCTLSNPSITDQPNNGTVTVNANGTLTYTPDSTFVGTDTIMYSTCDNQTPSKCDTTLIIVTVNPTGAANTTSANDDNATANGNTPLTGNVLTNDTDPEGNTQTVATQNVTNTKGTLVLNSNGTYTFTAAAGYSGPVEYTYTVCDNGTPSACDTATLHILVLPPDLTPSITITPNILHGISTFNATVKVTELNAVNTNGTITVRIPKDSRVTFTYNSALTTLGFTTVNNSAWTYNGTNPFFHIFTTTNVIAARGSLTFGFFASFDPLNTDGNYTMTSTISSGSGSETKTTNNNDSESADYFNN